MDEFRAVGHCIVDVLRALAQRPADNGAAEADVHEKVRELCTRFPIYGELGTEHASSKELVEQGGRDALSVLRSR